VIKLDDMYIKIDTVSVKPYVIGYDIRGGIALPFPVLDMRLHSADAVDRSVTIAQGSVVSVYACGQGTFTVEKVEREDNQLHILAVHSSAILRTKVSDTGFTGQPEAIFSTIAQSIGYAVGDVVTTTTSYGSVTTMPGERLLDTIKYLSQLTGCRFMFDHDKAYFLSVADMSSSTVNIATATPNTSPIYRPTVDADASSIINSVKVVHELGEILDDDATSISANGERFAEFRCLSTTTSAGVKPTADATAQAARILTDWKDKKVGLSYEISERARDGTDKVWSQAYGHVSKGTITDALSGTTLTSVPLNVYHHKYPTFTSVYHWNAGGIDDISSELSGLWSDVDNMVYSGTIGNDLSSRPVALQVYGDQSLSDFNSSTLTGFYLGKLKDGSGNDVYLWAGVNAGTEQVRMDTDGKMKAGAGRIVLDASGMTTNDGTNTQVTIGTDGKVKAGGTTVVLDSGGLSLISSTSIDTRSQVKWFDSTGTTLIGRIQATGNSTTNYLGIAETQSVEIAPSKTVTIQLMAPTTSDFIRFIAGSGKITAETVNTDYDSVFVETLGGVFITTPNTKPVTINSGRLDASGCRQIVIPTNTIDPSSPVAGSMYFNTSNNQLRIYNGSTWRYEEL